MKSLKKKVLTILLAGTMVVASLVPASAGYSSTGLTVNGHEFLCTSFCYDTYGSAEIEHVCADDCLVLTTNASVSATLFVSDIVNGGIIEYDSSFCEGEYEDILTTSVVISERDRRTYVSSRTEADFTAVMGTYSGEDDLTVNNN